MSLFALNNEFQRSIYRAWEDFSDDSRARARPDAAGGESGRPQSFRRPGNQAGGFVQGAAQHPITLREASESAFLQHDAKAWRRFLDSKRTE